MIAFINRFISNAAEILLGEGPKIQVLLCPGAVGSHSGAASRVAAWRSTCWQLCAAWGLALLRGKRLGYFKGKGMDYACSTGKIMVLQLAMNEYESSKL